MIVRMLQEGQGRIVDATVGVDNEAQGATTLTPSPTDQRPRARARFGGHARSFTRRPGRYMQNFTGLKIWRGW